MTADQSQAIGRFFDSLRGEYTEAIERCFPRYREMLWAVLDYLPRDRSYPTILELGCGTGNLTQLLMEAYPQAAIQAVDVSGESLAVCHSRLAHSGRLTCRQVDFRQLELPASSLPLVVSSIAIHHLTSAEKRQLFRQVYDWLVPGGVFCFADQCAAPQMTCMCGTSRTGSLCRWPPAPQPPSGTCGCSISRRTITMIRWELKWRGSVRSVSPRSIVLGGTCCGQSSRRARPSTRFPNSKCCWAETFWRMSYDVLRL